MKEALRSAAEAPDVRRKAADVSSADNNDFTYTLSVSASGSVYVNPSGLVARDPDGTVAIHAIPGESQLRFNVAVAKGASGDPHEVGLDLVSRVIDRLAVGTRSYVGNPRVIAATDERRVPRVNSLVRLFGNPMAESTGSPPLGDLELMDFISTNHGPGERYFGLLRLSYEETDPIATFMVLYLVLLNVNGDNQDKVDAFIAARDPKVAMHKSSRRDGRKVTVYTYLRNRLSHLSGDLDLHALRREMRERIPGLREHTLAAVGAYSP